MEKLASADGDSRFVVIGTRKQNDLRRGPWGWGQIAKHGEQEACTGAVADGALAFGIANSGVARKLTHPKDPWIETTLGDLERIEHEHLPAARL